MIFVTFSKIIFKYFTNIENYLQSFSVFVNKLQTFANKFKIVIKFKIFNFVACSSNSIYLYTKINIILYNVIYIINIIIIN